MSHHDRLQSELRSVLDCFEASRPLKRLHAGEIGVPHYASHLRQNYFQLRERPVILALAASRLTSSPEALKLLHKRAVEEVFHDRLALNDLQALGVNTSGIPQETPLPETTAVLAFGHYQIQRLNPVGILGSIHFLDLAPLYASDAPAPALERVGVPTAALSSLRDLAAVGPQHQAVMKTLVDELVLDEDALDAALHGMRTTATLFTRMIEAAFEAADQAS